MNTEQFLIHLRSLGVQLFLREGKLRSLAPKGTMGSELQQEILSRKQDLIAFLRDSATVTGNIERIPVHPRHKPLPLSFAQRQLWFLDQMEGGRGTTYLVFSVLRLEGRFDTGIFDRCVANTVARHEILRSIFFMEDGEPVQKPWNGPLPVTPLLDLTGIGLSKETELTRITGLGANQSFRVSLEPPVRLSLIRLAEENHVALVALHHLVCDAWSLGILVREIATAYTSLLAGQSIRLPELPLQYADFAAWQQTRLQGEEFDRQVRYWRERLRDLPPLLDFPTDWPRPRVQRFRGRTLHFTVEKKVADGLNALAVEAGASLFMVLLGTLFLLLARYSGKRDVAVSTPIFNRSRPELENLIGFFINSLVLRVKVDETLSFGQWLARVRSCALAAYENQDVPFDHLVEILRPERSSGYAPLAQVRFILQNTAAVAVETPGLRLRTVSQDMEVAKFDILLSMTETARGLTGSLQYNSDLFGPGLMERFVAQFQKLLTRFCHDPSLLLAEAGMTSPTERIGLLIGGPRQSGRETHTVHGMFEQAARQFPDRIAAVSGSRYLGYGSLSQRSELWAQSLVSLIEAPETRVALCLNRGFELAIGMLAVLKAGGTFVPIDPDLPKSRIETIFRDAHPSVVMSLSAWTDRFPTEKVLCPDQSPARPETNRPLPRVAPENLAYLVYTSGSSGEPKGIGVHHGAMVSYVRGLSPVLKLRGAASFGFLASPGADLGFTAIFGAWCTGHCLHLLPDRLSLDPEGLARELGAHPLDCFKIVPSHLAALLSASKPERLLPRQCLVFGGEALSSTLVSRIRRLAPDLRMINHYGPAETTVGVLVHEVSKDDGDREQAIPIGTPLGAANIYVLDRLLRPLPVGPIGEIFIGGPSLARGYPRHAAATAHSFLPDLFSLEPGSRMYRSGDAARLSEKGKVLFRGRVDRQVNIRGFRVEPDEIERQLNRHPDLRETAVVARERDGNTELIAYVVPDRVPGPDPDTLRAWLRKRIPAQMVPAGFQQVARLPRTLNGKIDRRSLPAFEAGNVARAFVEPGSGTERLLADIWKEVLNLEKVGMYDDFFALGGHSLLAMLVATRIRDHFDLRVPLDTLFEASTLAELTEEVQRLRKETELLSVLTPGVTDMDRDDDDEMVI